MAYETIVISEDRCHALRDRYAPEMLHDSKADINGICVQLYTTDRDHIDSWRDNFYAASDRVRSHARLFCIFDPDEPLRLEFEPKTCTGFLFNIKYYGWVKSIALGIAGYILEEAHRIFSVHGAALSIAGAGVGIIAPPKTGKTTQSWGLLRGDKSYLISDDWFFVKMSNRSPIIRGSERNCYISADIGDVWDVYKPLTTKVRFDDAGRGIADIRWVGGETAVTESAPMLNLILMKRDYSDSRKIAEMDADDAVAYLSSNDFCNPHQIVRGGFRTDLRTRFFKKLFEQCNTYMVNTTGTPQETQEMIREILGMKK